MHSFWFHLQKFSVENPHEIKLTPEEENLWKEAFNNPDYRVYPHIFNLLERKGKMAQGFFRDLINPFELENVEEMEEDLKGINIPFYVGTGWYAYTYKSHLFGALRYWREDNSTPLRFPFVLGLYHREGVGIEKE